MVAQDQEAAMLEARSYQAKEASEALHAGRVGLLVGERGVDLAFDRASIAR